MKLLILFVWLCYSQTVLSVDSILVPPIMLPAAMSDGIGLADTHPDQSPDVAGTRLPNAQHSSVLHMNAEHLQTLRSRALLVIYPHSSIGLLQLIQALQDTLTQYTVTAVNLQQQFGADDAAKVYQPAEVVTLGYQATRHALTTYSDQTRIYSLLVSLDEAARLQQTYPTTRLHSIVMDQPLSRQREIISQLLPNTRKLCLIQTSSPGLIIENQHPVIMTREAIQQEFALSDIEVEFATVSEIQTVSAAVKQLAIDNQALLALPDKHIYNNNNVISLLLASYENRLPIIGFSRAFTEAGAVLAVHTLPSMYARQLEALLLATDKPLLSYPADYTVTVNQHMARTLGMTINTQQIVSSTH